MWPLVGRLGRAKQHVGVGVRERQEVPKSQTRTSLSRHAIRFIHRLRLPIHYSTDALTNAVAHPKSALLFSALFCHKIQEER